MHHLVRPYPRIDDALQAVGIRFHPEVEFSTQPLVHLDTLPDLDVYPELRLDVAVDRIAQHYGDILDSLRLVVIVREKAIHRSRSIFESPLDCLPPVLRLYQHAVDVPWDFVSGIATYLVLGTSLEQEPPGRPHRKGHWLTRKEFVIRSPTWSRQLSIQPWNATDFQRYGLPPQSTYAAVIENVEELFRSDGNVARAVRIGIDADVYRTFLGAKDERLVQGLHRLIVADTAAELLVRALNASESRTIESGSPINSLLLAVSERGLVPREQIEHWARELLLGKVRAVFQALLQTNENFTRATVTGSMRYPALPKETAEQYLAVPSAELVEWRGFGEPFPVEELQQCATLALERLEQFAVSRRIPLSARAGGYFERDIVPSVHSTLAAIFARDPRPAYDEDFWRWAAVGPFRMVIERRHGGSPEGVHPDNFGFGSLKENFVYRVWLRGEIGYDPATFPDHPYRIALLGDQDVWRSHVFRQSYGSCHRFIRAFIRVLYPDLQPLPDGEPLLTTPAIRALAKRLRRLYKAVTLESLSEDDYFVLINEQINLSLK
ncbi:MAG: hypothetical protein NZ562_03970 [Thermomicrobium sp.]|nr:hypothetical protein [Thermomicrobium sp.]